MVDQVHRLAPGEPFAFRCHPGKACFTHCCRELELALTPYDVLRLRQATGLSSADLLERYIIVERVDDDPFPRFYLTMVDDGQASCVFVNSEGCSVYPHRPGACRAYPVGRATIRKADSLEEFFVLLHEEHCHGFQEHNIQTAASYMIDQDLERYNKFNDLLTEITQHERIRQGMKLTDQQGHAFALALYDIDSFRDQIRKGCLPVKFQYPASIWGDDEALLLYGHQWLKCELFG